MVDVNWEKAIDMGIPELTVSALERYINDRIPTGGFLDAVLRNDLFGAISRADEFNSRSLPEIVKFIYNNLPGNSWGDSERIKSWLNGE